MSEDCTHDCSSCQEDCASRTKSLIEAQNMYSDIKKVIAVISGKGGVGKSFVTSMLAVKAAKQGKKVAIMDADITGPSIPKIFGIRDKAISDGRFIYPAETALGIKIMSINLLLEKDTDPVVWRGPVIAGTVKQFWTDVVWGDIDEMYIDCPPGTGDVPLTIFQSVPIDGIVVVTTPQSLVSMVVEKAEKMAQLMNVKILGLVENMSYYVCPDCQKKHYIFGDSHVDETAKAFGIENVLRLSVDPEIAKKCDDGQIETLDFPEASKFVESL